MLLLKGLSRLVEIALMAAIALVGIGVGLYCFSGLISLGSARPDRLVHLPQIVDRTGHFLAQTAKPGPVAIIAVIAGVVAVIVGLLLILGLLGSRRERVLVIEDDGEGVLAARTRPVAELLRTETETAPGVTGSRRVKIKLHRSGLKGKAKIRATRGPDPDAETVDTTLHGRLDPISKRFALRNDVRVRLIDPNEGSEATS